MPTLLRTLLPSLALLTLLTACAGLSKAADPVKLEGSAWVLADLGGQPALADSAPTLRFEQGRANGSDGCNRYSQPFTTQGATLGFGPQGIGTQMACPPELMARASAFQAALGATRNQRLVDGRLELLGADGTVLARFVAQATTLAGTNWTVRGYNNGKQAVTSVRQGTELNMSFGTDGRVSGSAGCNTFSGSFTQDGGALSFGPAMSTRKMCGEPEGVMEQEAQFLKALTTVSTVRVEGESAELRTADGALAVQLAK